MHQAKSQNAFNQSPWLSTMQAARQLGVHPDTLKRYAKRDMLLHEGTHFRRGPHNNSSLQWNLRLCFETLHGAGQQP